MEVLTCLAKRQGQVVSRDEIVREVWQGTCVSDDSLTRCIVELRHSFGDDAREPKIIKTVAKRGYVLLAPVTWEENGAPSCLEEPVDLHCQPPVAQPPPILRSRIWLAVLSFVLVVAAALLCFGVIARHKLAASANFHSIRRVAVLPLANLSADAGQDYLAEAMTDQLITELAQSGRWEVISRTSVMRYTNTRQSLRSVARELAVDAVVEGTVQRFGQHVRITVQLRRYHGPTLVVGLIRT
jgi:DNA-binding winged helix-turn-helix (wHTH) protein/TolB-like protein